jgi:hypothetical protein
MLRIRKGYRLLFLLLWIGLLGLFFAMTEIQIEGSHGWAANLPTWRIEKHPLLDIFWEGKPMTGYHVWVFTFMAAVFHLPLVMAGRFSLRLEARCAGSVMLFWVVEDFLWFALNPAFGLGKLAPRFAPWHKAWFLGLPVDYTIFGSIGVLLILSSFLEIDRGRLRE